MEKIVFFTLIIISISELKAQYVGVYEASDSNGDYFLKNNNWPEAVKCYSELLEREQ